MLCTVCLAVIVPARLSLGAEVPPQATEGEVKALEQRWFNNENRSDVVQSILADDFVHVLPSGFIGKNDHLAYLRQHSNAFAGTERFEELRVRIYGNVAIAAGIVSAVRNGDIKPKRTAFHRRFRTARGKLAGRECSGTAAGTGKKPTR